ncbi:MAG TPA: 1-deoxy-D-xylulose-5-phosphate reductoisomerase, partial [Denitromonas sp.]|nr:1-deoxy-D-xylulose-5-phosphate reductoisomerase [Denitromonas sp.]
MQSLTVLGATGSIGVSTLDVVARHPDRYRIFALSGKTQLARLAEQCAQFSPRYAVVDDAAAATRLQGLIAERGASTEVLYGADQLAAVAEAPEVDAVMAAI